MSNKQMQKRVASMREALFKQGYLDEQFSMLEELEDTENPNFCEEIVTMFFRDYVRHINDIDRALAKNPINFEKLEDLMHHFKGCCCRVRGTFEQLKKESATLKTKLEAYFQAARQAGPSQTADRPK
ncbi:pseudo histidine-containing phosphotransfer protein 5-like [Papaver somniferum]|uniref:pseudo histidine-containing phosphotransfer protein 5-like n=1 Tax=Papaver somniferum TaxID=3469 RepID=UPI000E6FC0E0|nr:pseudo histidine-containing phosphotransfer protein 5-like [Papaver somniferum]